MSISIVAAMSGTPSSAANPLYANLVGPGGGVPEHVWNAQQPVMPQSSLLNAQLQSQLQYQIAKQQAYQAQADSLYRPVPMPNVHSRAPQRFSSLDLPNPRLTAPQEPVSAWPSAQPSSTRISSMQPRPAMLPNWQDAVQMNFAGLEEGTNVQQYIAQGPSLQTRNPQLDTQVLAIDRLRRELTSTQTELDRAEREVVRQKSLRETERLEFTEAKDRLKHSWANDREDFARVKTILKMKNAEHHAQSGRLSQQLKDCQACNRALRELAARHGVSVPMDLDSSQTKRLLPPPFSEEPRMADMAMPSSSAGLPVAGRNSHDSYFREKSESRREEKYQSLPNLLGAQLTLSAEQGLSAQEAGNDSQISIAATPPQGQQGIFDTSDIRRF